MNALSLFDLPTLGFYGVLHLSKELENPYGWDFNDIDLNSFQKSLHEDMMTIHACAFGEVRPRPAKRRMSHREHAGVYTCTWRAPQA